MLIDPFSQLFLELLLLVLWLQRDFLLLLLFLLALVVLLAIIVKDVVLM